jgi:hypothetical protein
VRKASRRGAGLAVLLGAVLLLLALRRNTQQTSVPATPASARDVNTTVARAATSAQSVRGVQADAGIPRRVIEHTVRDRTIRDELRRQIFVAWAEGMRAAPDASAVDTLHAPMPTRGDGLVDPDYLRARIREDFVPMATTCYESFVARASPGATTSGRVVTDFVIVGDEHMGAVVDEVSLDDAPDGGAAAISVGDAEFRTCLRESMMAMAFAPPPRGGRLRVRYPFHFAPGDGGTTHDD